MQEQKLFLDPRFYSSYCWFLKFFSVHFSLKPITNRFSPQPRDEPNGQVSTHFAWPTSDTWHVKHSLFYYVCSLLWFQDYNFSLFFSYFMGCFFLVCFFSPWSLIIAVPQGPDLNPLSSLSYIDFFHESILAHSFKPIYVLIQNFFFTLHTSFPNAHNWIMIWNLYLGVSMSTQVLNQLLHPLKTETSINNFPFITIHEIFQ
jgi:hypothetical protein